MQSIPVFRISLLGTLLLLAAPAFATPEISLEMTAEREVTVEEDDGTTRTERVETTNATPGEALHYTIRYTNTGTSAARNINIDNPVPEGTRYIEDSAWGESSEIRFAVNTEEGFKLPTELTYETSDGEQRKARPEQYSAIRWVIEEIPAGGEGEVGFSVLVE